MDKSRRHFLGVSAAALAGITVLPSLTSCAGADNKAAAPADGKVNSNFAGVAMGCITYSFRGTPGGLENLLGYCKDAGVSNLELMGNDLEGCLGIPESPQQRLMAEARAAAERAGQTIQGGRMQLGPEAQAEMAKYQETLKAWRANMDWDKVAEVRKRFNDLGIDIHIVKTSPGANSSDEDLDYAFKLAKAMGARAVTTELSLDAAKRVAPFAEKNDMILAFHNHMQYSTDEWKDGPDPVLAISPNIMLNFDQGHYFGSTGKHPVDFIKKYGDRIYSIHMKDKTGPNAQEPNANQVWGQGQTPLEDLLHYIRDEKKPFYCDIELEYPVKPWSNAVREVGICINYARQILL